MNIGTVIKCDREAKEHSGGLRKDGDGYICQECWASERGIELKKAKGKDTICPNCGKALMTKYRGGKISIGNMRMRGSTATLKCDCGYEKVVRNPFAGRPQTRDEMAWAKLRNEGKNKKEVKDGSP